MADISFDVGDLVSLSKDGLGNPISQNVFCAIITDDGFSSWVIACPSDSIDYQKTWSFSARQKVEIQKHRESNGVNYTYTSVKQREFTGLKKYFSVKP